MKVYKDGKRAMPKKKTEKVILFIIEFALIALAAFSAYKIYLWNSDNQNTTEVLDTIKQSVTVDEVGEPKVDFNTIKATYPDTVGWIKVEGTDVNYPVVQSNDNDYYLNHSIDGSSSGAGWIYADYKNQLDGTDKNIVIYGHNRRDGSMFSSLLNILKSDWYNDENNRFVTFITEQGNTKYEVFSVYQIENEEYYINTYFGSNKSFSSFVNTLKGRSIKDFGTEVTADDSILTLSTCGNDKKYRVVLHAKKTELQNDNEDFITEY